MRIFLSKLLGAFCFCLISTPVVAKLEVIGAIPDKPQLLAALCDVDNRQVFKQHKAWITEAFATIQSPDSSSRSNILDKFSEQDIEEILSKIFLQQYNYNLRHSKIEEIIVERYEKTQLNKNISGINDKKEKTQASPAAFLNLPWVKQEIFTTAEKIADSAKGNIVIALGQTPSYIAAMLSAINSKLDADNKMQIITLPFSGKPDQIYSESRSKSSRYNYRNLLTTKKELVFRSILTQKGLSPKSLQVSKKKIYIVDDSTGPSLAHFLLIYTRWYKENNILLPDLHFLSLQAEDDYHIYYNGKKESPSKDKPFDLRVNSDLTFKIEHSFLALNKEVRSFLVRVPKSLRVTPPFHSFAWNDNYQELFAQYPTVLAKKVLRKYKNYALFKVTQSK